MNALNREDLGDPWRAMQELNRHLNDAFDATLNEGDQAPDPSVIRDSLLEAILIAQRFLPEDQRHLARKAA